jgi:hypothetical protein
MLAPASVRPETARVSDRRRFALPDPSSGKARVAVSLTAGRLRADWSARPAETTHSGGIFMLRKTALAFFAALALCAAVTRAHADEVKVVLDYTGNYLVTGTVSPAGNPGGATSGLIICLDYSRGFVTAPYVADTHTFADLSGTKFGEAARSKYVLAAWLYDQMVLNPGDQKNIQYAIWGLFNTAAPQSLAADQWLALAKQKVVGFDVSNFVILTPRDGSLTGPQEMITKIIRPPHIPEIPEPATLVLVGSGVSALLLRRRRRGGKPAA